MALEETFEGLVVKWRQLHEVAQALRITTVEDPPAEGAVLLTERCADAVEDLLGWTAEGLAAAIDAQQRTSITPDWGRARHALRTSQQHFVRLDDEFSTFASYEHMTELVEFGRKKRGEWLGWVDSVSRAICECREPIREVRHALVHCWHELSEHCGTSVVIQNTNIGQQISTRSSHHLKDEAGKQGR